MPHIIVFGASVTYGAWDVEGGWVARLRKYLDKKVIIDAHKRPKDFYLLYNLGVSGDTSANILKRLDHETTARINHQTKTIFILSFGLNDCIIENKRYLVKQSMWQQNITTIIRTAKKYSKKVILIGLTKINELETNPLSWDGNKFLKNRDITKYNSLLKSECKKEKILFIEIIDEINAKVLRDGLHPNSKGHEKIFEVVKEHLIKNKII